MGCLILNNNCNNGKGFDLIDGQQRITTLAILIKALADKFNRYKDIENLIICHINHNRIDKNDFEAVMKEGYEGEEYSKKKEYKSQIKKCYDYFKHKLNDDDLKNQENLLNNLNKIKFGIILLPSNHQQDIFDRLNSNAVPLTQAELIKNYLFQDNEKGYEEVWYKNFEENKEDLSYWDLPLKGGRNIDVFLFSLFYANSNQSSSIKKGKLKDYFEEKTKEEWIELITNNASKYKECIKPNIQKEKIESPLDRVNLIIFTAGYQSAIPYLFYTYSNKSDEKKETAYKNLEKYLILRLITDGITKGYNDFFVNLKDKDIFDDVANRKNESLKMPTKEEIKKQFKEGKWLNDEAKLVLYLIEHSTLVKGVMNINLKKFKEYHLEHIIPQEPQKWKEEFTNIIENEKQGKYIYNIGNMIFLTEKLNKQNSNRGRKEKAEIMEGKMIGVTTFETYNLRDWNASKITTDENWDNSNTRSKYLFDKACEIWYIK